MRTPRYKQIVDFFATEIRSGRLTAGTPLPTHRILAKQYHIALATATKVYSELALMGLVSGETGRGTFVRDQTRPPGYGPMTLQSSSNLIDLAFNYPESQHDNAFLRDALRDLASTSDIQQLMQPQPTQGRERERHLVSVYLKQYQINCTADDLILTSGTQQGLAVALLSLLKPGDLLAVDALTYPGIISLAKAYGIELVPIPMAQHALNLVALETMMRKRPIKAIYCMPTLHNPMGTVMGLKERETLIHLARSHNAWIIEDACYAFLVENAPPPLVALAPECCIYVSSITKIIGGGIRFGYLHAPQNVITNFVETLQSLTWSNPTLLSCLAGKWLENQTVQLAEQQKRANAHLKHTLAMRVLNHLSITAHPDSFFVWIPLPENVRTEQLLDELEQHHIKVAASHHFAAGNHFPHAIRLSLGAESLETLEKALPLVQEQIEMLSLW